MWDGVGWGDGRAETWVGKEQMECEGGCMCGKEKLHLQAEVASNLGMRPEALATGIDKVGVLNLCGSRTMMATTDLDAPALHHACAPTARLELLAEERLSHQG